MAHGLPEPDRSKSNPCTLLLGSGWLAGFDLDLATSPAGVRRRPRSSDPCRLAISPVEKASVAGAFPLPARCAARPLCRFRWKSRVGPVDFVRTPLGAGCPPAVCSAPAPLPSNAGIPNITATDGWMRMRPSKIPSRTRPQPCRHAGGRHVRIMRGGSQRRAVAQPHGMMPTGPEFLARTDPLANLQGTSVRVGYSGEDRPG